MTAVRNETLLELVNMILLTMVDSTAEYIDEKDYDTVLTIVYDWIREARGEKECDG